jgi:putative ABC transport system substrate-binding protein
MRTQRSAFAGMLLALLFSSGLASAQQEGRVYRIGWLFVGSWDYEDLPIEKWASPGAAFRVGLQAAGYVAGKNFVLERRHAKGDAAGLVAEAKALVASGVDVIVTAGSAPTVAAMQATRQIPIVFFAVSYPIEKGMVASLARPGGNVTGMAVVDAIPRQWQLLREVAPAVRRAGRLEHAANRPADERYAAYRSSVLDDVKADAAAVGIEPIRMGVFGFNDIEPLLAELSRRGEAGVVVINDPLLVSPDWRPSIMEMAIRHRLPTSCARASAWARSGCLVTYTEDWSATLRGLAGQVVRVLGGTRPADIPVEQAAGQQLIVNARTAKALGLTIPPSILARADEVIE